MAGLVIDNATQALRNLKSGQPVNVRDDNGLTIASDDGTSSVNLNATAATTLTLTGDLKITGNLDLDMGQAKNFRFENATSDPGTTAAGLAVFRTDTDVLRVRNGADSAWLSFSPGGLSGTLVAGQIPVATGTSTLGAGDANLLFDTSTHVFTLGGTNKTRMVHTVGTLGDGETGHAMTATLHTGTSTQVGVDLTITSAGSSTGDRVGLRNLLGSGYTGSNGTFAAFMQNSCAGSDTSILAGNSNYGIWGGTNGSTSGTCTGIHGDGAGATAGLRIGVSGYGHGSHASAVNVGVLGTAPTSSGAAAVGGWFTFGTTVPTTTRSALAASNGSTSDAIFTGYDNTTAVYTIADKGIVTHACATLGDTEVGYVFTATQNNTAGEQRAFSISATPGGNTASPVALYVNQPGGYSGTGIAITSKIANNSSSSGYGVGNTLAGNFGVYIDMGTSAGGLTAGLVTNVGNSTNHNIGIIGRAVGTSGTNNVGVLGIIGSVSPTNSCAGYFGIKTSNPNFVSAALVADNGSAAVPIFLARDNETIRFSVEDGGQTVVTADAGFLLKNSAGTQGLMLRPVRGTTTNTATPTEMTIDNAGSVYLTLASGTTHAYSITVLAKATAGTNSGKVGMWRIDVAAANISGTTALIGESLQTIVCKEIAGWDVTVNADDTNDRLALKVTGDAATTISWSGWVNETVI